MQNQLGWQDLTVAERALVSNGCGGKGGFIKPPDFMFEADCNRHDFYYWRGGNYLDRLTADQGFLQAMLRDARYAPNPACLEDWCWSKRHSGRCFERRQKRPLIRRCLFSLIAWAYYLAVRLFGGPFFHWGPQRGRAELAALHMAVYNQLGKSAPQSEGS